MGQDPDRTGSDVTGAVLGQWYEAARQAAIAAGVAPTELIWFLTQMAEVDRLDLKLGTLADRPLVRLAIPLAELTDRWQKRLVDRQPVQYLVGQTRWRQFDLTVGPGVLIPRPETELLVDWAVAVARSNGLAAGRWLDLGTGSGAIALALAAELPEAEIWAVDCSAAALAIARQNAIQTGLADRVRWIQSDWFTALDAATGDRFAAGRFAGLISNPPYIPTADLPTLAPEVIGHEPSLALDGGADGLVAVRHLAELGPVWLEPGGWWGVELMAGQAPAVVDLLTAVGGYGSIASHADWAGIERFVTAHRLA